MADGDHIDLSAPGTTAGPVVRPANRSLDATGSIHDDATAERLGFRGGTVAGNAHLDHFGPLLVERFGPGWFERGALSMYFRSPTTHLEPVRAFLGPADEGRSVPAGVATLEGDIVALGDASADGTATTALDRRNRRPVTDPTALRLLADLPIGTVIEAGTTALSMQRQRQLLADEHLMTAPLDWYDDSSPWGPPVACPSTMVDMLWAPFERRLRGLVQPAVGLYGAIELRMLDGPLAADTTYTLSGMVETVSASPRSEIFWARTTATHDDGRAAASLLMMIRLLPESAA